MAGGLDDILRRSSQRTRAALFLARTEATERGAPALATEHLLLGLLLEDQGAFQRVLGDMRPIGTTTPHHPTAGNSFLPPELANTLVSLVYARCGRSRSASPGSDIPVSDGVERAFVEARSLADDIRANEVEPLHLLATIAGNQSHWCGEILRTAGLTSDKVLAVRQGPTGLPSDRPISIGPTAVAIGPSIYSQRARDVLYLARLKACRRGSASIETEDFLAALVIEDQGLLPEAVASMGIDLPHPRGRHRPFLSRDVANHLLARTEALCGRSEPLPPGSEVIMSGPVKRVLAAASQLCGERGESELQPLHFLAAISAAEVTASAKILDEAGISRERVLEAIQGAT